jgi:hypothetical protein
MAEPVSSWFVPQNILDLVSPKEAEAAANQARNTFIAGLLTGDIGAAYNNAQNQGYNTLSHGAALQEAKRKQQQESLLQDVTMNAFDKVGGIPLAGPTPQGGNIPVNPVTMGNFNPQALKADPRAAFVDQTRLKALLENFGPKLDAVRGQIIDMNNPANVERYVPQLGENMMPMGKNAQGQTVYGNAPGTVSAASQLAGAVEGAKESAKASYDLVPVKGADGSTFSLTRSQAVNMARSGNPAKSELSPLQTGVQKADADLYSAWRTDSQNKALAAPDRRTNAEIAYALADRIDGNKLTPVKAEAMAYLRSIGITGPEADQYLGDVALFNKVRSNRNLQGLSSIKGNANEAELMTVSQGSFSLTDPKAQTKFNSALEIAIANKDEARDKFVQTYKGDPKQLGVSWAQSEQNVPIYRDPKVINFVKENFKATGQVPAGFEIIKSDNKRYIVFPDQSNALLK